MTIRALIVSVLAVASPLFAWDYSTEITPDIRTFFKEGLYGNTTQLDASLSVQPELSHSWDDDRKVVSFIAFGRYSDTDSKRSHFDIREASFVGSWDAFDFRAGISRVYWGVTESQHLVDVVNQTDLVENLDGEDKFGQPMINVSKVTDYGELSYFLLPYFRERSFPGQNGRYRAALLVDTAGATYSSSDEENHIDHAIRYSHYISDLEFGVSYFNGTDREPTLVLNGSTLTPHYVQAEQVGLDAQYIWKSLAVKFEGIWKDRETRNEYYATTTGFEYTFSNIYKGWDIGVLTEYLHDERGKNSEAAFNNHTFVGGRISMNNEDGTEFLAGTLFNNDTQELQSFRVETSSRINNDWRWEFELNMLFNTDDGQLFHSFREDDHARLSLSYFI